MDGGKDGEEGKRTRDIKYGGPSLTGWWRETVCLGLEVGVWWFQRQEEMRRRGE